MTGEEFVSAIQEVVVGDSVAGNAALLKRPPGRSPNANLLELSGWFTSLSKGDQEMVIRVMTMAAESAAFGFFAVLDGARAIESGHDKGHLELWFVQGGTRRLLNDPAAEELHELYREIRSLL